MSQPAARRFVAVTLAVSVLAMSASGPLLAQSAPSLTGRVLAGDGATARAGVVVALVGSTSESVYRSQPTDARGAFRVDAPAAGRYALLVEAPEGAFLASDGMELRAGANKPVALALKPGRQGEPPAPAPAPPAGTTPPPPANTGLPTWAKWVIAGGIVVGAAIVVDAVASDDDEASTF